MLSKHKKTILNLLTYVIGVLLVCTLLPRFLRFFMPFFIGWIISLIANPLVKFFEKRLKIMRKHGTWVVIVATLALVISACYLVISWLTREAIGFIKNLPEMYSSMMAGFHDIENNLSVIIPKLPFNLNEGFADFFANIDTYIGNLVGTFGVPTLSFAGDIVSHLPNILLQGIFMFLAAYFFIADKEKISVNVRKVIPQIFRDHITLIKEMFSRAVFGYFKAQFKIMGVIATILFIGFLILRVDYAILWAILIAILDFIPFLGTGTAIWPWAAFQLLTGDYYMAIGLMIIYVICLLVHQLLQPKFVGDTVGMDPLATLVCMFIGYRFSSVVGMIIAVPIGIIIINLYKAGAFDKIIQDVKALIEDFNTYRKN